MIDRTIVYVDTETAALTGAPFLLELGAVRVTDGEVTDSFDELVLAPVPIDPDATEIHGITDDDLRRAKTPEEVLTAFTDWVGDDWLAAHNAGFDARVLGFEYRRAGLEMPGAPFLDSLKLARRAFPESPDHKLQTLCQHLDLEEGTHHRALADAVWCWRVTEACAEAMETTSGAQLMQWCGSPVTVPAYVPADARISPRLRPLVEAVREGDDVTLLYGENDAGAPAHLQVRPRLLYERHKKSYLEAECLRTGTLKTYLLDRIRKVV